jgi:signal transduction histidine kinase
MSHDLRTPLTRIRLRVESLEDESLRNRFIADLDEMNGMISGALSLFRGLNEEEPESECDIAELLGNLRDDFAEIGVTVDVEGDALRPIRLRPLAIKRCLTNLISNAAKFASNPRVLVEDGAACVTMGRESRTRISSEFSSRSIALRARETLKPAARVSA